MGIRKPVISMGSEPPSVVLDADALSDEALATARDTHSALVATGMDPFKAIGPAVGDDRLAAAHFWMSALRMVDIPTGTFRMGSPEQENGHSDKEGPLHEVTIAHPFRMEAMTVTQGCWEALMGTNPSHFSGDPRLPVEQVSWNAICEADGFLARLNAITKGTRPEGQVFRLPTEAEWEHACRAGTDTAYSFGDDSADLGAHGWFDRNAGGRTHPVGQKNPNPWGLHDMHGNLWEWCADTWHHGYNGAPTDGSAWRDRSEKGRCVLRGGSWEDDARFARSAYLRGCGMCVGADHAGFRLVLGVPFRKSMKAKA